MRPARFPPSTFCFLVSGFLPCLLVSSFLPPLRRHFERSKPIFSSPFAPVRFCIPDGCAGRMRRPAQRDLRPSERFLRGEISRHLSLLWHSHSWLCAFTQRSIARHDTFPLPARVILALPVMPKPEAFSRVLIDQALKDSGWDLLDERRVRFELDGKSGRK